MAEYRKFGSLSSSSNPENLSLTVKGILVGLIPLLVLIVGQFGVELAANELLELADAVLVAISAVMLVIGLFRKLYLKVFKLGA